MIRINRIDIDEIASSWASIVKIYLNESLDKQKRARYKDRAGVNHLFDKRIEKYKFIYEEKTSPIAAVSAATKGNIWKRISENLDNDDFLTGNRHLCKKWMRWYNLYVKNNELRAVIKDIFVSIYEGVASIIAYDIFERLNIRTCPYCNRHYTFTLHTDKNIFKTRPEFDHFYDKSAYPLLAVTFFNLVPSCKECNHGKRNGSCGINPYFDAFISKFVICKPDDEELKIPDGNIMNVNEILKISKESDFTINFKKPEDAEVRTLETSNMDTLGLLPLYNMHKDYVMEIVEKASAYNELTRHSIIDAFQGLFHSETDIFNLIFGRYLSDASHSERPLSKLTADILQQLENISAHT